MNLRPYQSEMVARVFSSSSRSSLIEAMTGLGKTVTFAEIAKRWHGNVLVLVHREELADQAARTLESIAGEPVGIEMAARTTLDMPLTPPRIVVASVQTLVAAGGRRLEALAKRGFNLVIVDECHHAAARTWRRVLDKFPNARVLGVTATADRADEQSLRSLFSEVLYRYTAHEAIDDGWLVPAMCQSVRIAGLSYAGVRTTAGDLNGADLERVLTAERVPQGFAAGLVEAADAGHRVLAFCPSVACAETVCEIANRRQPGVAAFVSGQTSRLDREAIVRRFRDGDLKVLVNCSVFTEGFDVPHVSCIALCGATKSRAKYVQMVGRGLRTLPGLVDQYETAEARRAAIAGSDKPHLLILDFAGDTGRHRMVGPADVFAGKANDSIKAEVNRKIAESDEAMAIDEATDEVMAEIEAAKAREAARRAKLVADVQLRRSRVLDVRRLDGTITLPPAAVGDPPATERQVAMLDRAGFDTSRMTKKQANRLITEIIQRSKEGRCTIKQEALIRELGGEGDVSRMTRDEASTMIDRLRSYRRPIREVVRR